MYKRQYPTLLAEVHLDYFGRTYRRSIERFCKDGSCVADFGAGTLTLPKRTRQELCASTGFDLMQPFAIVTYHPETSAAAGDPAAVSYTHLITPIPH